MLAESVVPPRTGQNDSHRDPVYSVDKPSRHEQAACNGRPDALQVTKSGPV